MTEYIITISQGMKITFQKEQKLICSIAHCLTLFRGEGLERRNMPCGECTYGSKVLTSANT